MGSYERAAVQLSVHVDRGSPVYRTLVTVNSNEEGTRVFKYHLQIMFPIILWFSARCFQRVIFVSGSFISYIKGHCRATPFSHCQGVRLDQ